MAKTYTIRESEKNRPAEKANEVEETLAAYGWKKEWDPSQLSLEELR